MTVLGSRVRSLREERGLSLRDLAGETGVSAAMLSQVERGETSPTISVAERIAQGLDLSLSQLLRLDEAPAVTIVRAWSRHAVGRDGHRHEVLTPVEPGLPASVAKHALEVGARTGDAPLHEPGSREFAVVTAGRIRLVVDGSEHVLDEGDSVAFDADLTHYLENVGDVPASFISVLTAGRRR